MFDKNAIDMKKIFTYLTSYSLYFYGKLTMWVILGPLVPQIFLVVRVFNETMKASFNKD